MRIKVWIRRNWRLFGTQASYAAKLDWFRVQIGDTPAQTFTSRRDMREYLMGFPGAVVECAGVF